MMNGHGRPALVTGPVLASAVLASPAVALEEVYSSVSYSDALYRHTHGADGGAAVAATYEEWRADGFPIPTPAPADYVAYPWSTEVFAVHVFDHDRSSWVWNHLDEVAWTVAGRPSPRAAGWIDGSQFWSYGGSDEVFVRIGGEGRQHRLTFDEWLDAGAPTPVSRSSEAFYKYSWSPSVGHMLDRAYGFGTPIGYDEWLALDRPTPTVVVSIRGHRVWRHADSEQLYFDSAITGPGCPLTYAQWAATGRPNPADA